jgi:hypothetical protein
MYSTVTYSTDHSYNLSSVATTDDGVRRLRCVPVRKNAGVMVRVFRQSPSYPWSSMCLMPNISFLPTQFDCCKLPSTTDIERMAV